MTDKIPKESEETTQTAILEQYEKCCGVVNEMMHHLTKKSCNVSETYVRKFLKEQDKETRTLSEALKIKINEYYLAVPNNLELIQRGIIKDTPFRPAEATIRRVMREDLELKVFPRNQDEVRADRNVKKPTDRKKLNNQERKYFLYCESGDVYGRVAI